MNTDLAIEDAPAPGHGSELPDGMVGYRYSTTLTASGVSGNCQWTIADPRDMPLGLTLDDSTGTISGVPKPRAEGTTSITVKVSDDHATNERVFSLTINPAGLVIEGAPAPGQGNKLPDGMVSAPYVVILTASGGSGDYRWSIVSPPAMPPGLKLDDSTGAISGVPDPLAEGVTSITVQVSDASTSNRRSFLLEITPVLQISRDIGIEGRDSFKLEATGGSPPYTWELDGAKPGWLQLAKDGIIGIKSKYLRNAETGQFTAKVRDSAPAPHTDQASFSITARPASRWRHPLRPRSYPEIPQFEIEVRPKWRWPSFIRVAHLSFWLSIFALGVPTFGAIWIFIYAFTTPGSHGTYLGVAMLTGIAAFVIGCLIGFLFGIPRVISSGQARLGQSSDYTPSSNLSEVSDWLTKLLLGAGLVQLTHLGKPIGSLINQIAAALNNSATYSGAAKVAAGTIIFGYVAIGLLDGYVITTLWYQKKLAQPSTPQLAQLAQQSTPQHLQPTGQLDSKKTRQDA